MHSIYHIISKSDYQAALSSGFIAPESLRVEGFIHCSFANQVCGVANKFFSANTSMLLLEIDRRLAGCEVIDEDLYPLYELYPHIYGKLSMNAVVKVHPLEKAINGEFCLPVSIVV